MTDPARIVIRGPQGIVAVIIVPNGPADVDQGAIQDAFLARLLGDDPAENENASTRQPGSED